MLERRRIQQRVHISRNRIGGAVSIIHARKSRGNRPMNCNNLDKNMYMSS
ncbi:hypothetical protein HanXRQr2_Chr16g0759511 [Helianthus annuus]|uniref:Uncharacterized protein n=1 Tax=Helianthus annuus TaxID=4232 RepID=A0A9K3H167_HELAN|nr:hypothetical protein HanXRQr2_Chr16g0759511 [Helianthus annuus]KAJ0822080.1 hypothetical protein HanPSC8_Chr16g0727791 [Helianthus annuus]